MKTYKVFFQSVSLLILMVTVLVMGCSKSITDEITSSTMGILNCCGDVEDGTCDPEIWILQISRGEYAFVEAFRDAIDVLYEMDNSFDVYESLIRFLKENHGDSLFEYDTITMQPITPPDGFVLKICCDRSACSVICYDNGVNYCPKKNQNGKCWVIKFHEL